MTTPNLPGTIFRKVAIDALTPPQWVPVGNFAVGVPGAAGAKGPQGAPGQPGAAGATGAVSVLRGYIDGFVLTNDVSTPNTVLDFGAGNATDSTGTYLLNSVAMTKNCNASWASGNANGGNFLNTTLATSAWYHCFAIYNTTTKATDFGIDSSVTAANIPSGWTAYRRIGSIKTDGSSHILAFVQYGGEFYWATATKDVATTNPGTSAVTQTLNVPTGVVVKALSTYTIFTTNAYCDGYVSSLAVVDMAPGYSAGIFNVASDLNVESCPVLGIWTNTSAQVRTRLSASAAATTQIIWTIGWEDLRGRDN